MQHAEDNFTSADSSHVIFSTQTGLGRHGTKWWSYQHTNIVPDILIAGRSLGNGQPLAAVITSQQIGE